MQTQALNMHDVKDVNFEISPFFEITPDLVCIAGKDGYFKKVNSSVIDRFEYTEQELYSRPIFSFMHPEDLELTQQERAKLLKGQALVNFQNRYISKSGKIIWLHWTSIYFPEKEIVFAIAKDITEQKRLEKEIEEKYLRFKDIAAHFKSSIEKDRKHIAVELHEGLAQLAAAIKIDMSWLQKNLPESSENLKQRLEHTNTLAELMIKTIRRISFSISPSMIEDVGLFETINLLCKDFSVLNETPCVFEGSFRESLLTHEMKLDFFRICQEALRNVMLHANASAVKIALKDENNGICLTIVDNGLGFNVEEQIKTPGPGIKTMKERAASINGVLAIKSVIGQGTEICVRMDYLSK